MADATLLQRYYPVAIFAIVALLFPLMTFFMTRMFRPRNPTPLKDLTYECGEVPEGEAMVRFHFQYYVFAIMFLVFDVAAIFLLLWALQFGAFVDPVAASMPIFVLVALLFVATNYALKKEEVIQI
jgi:NADH:ubiquinone oxidoreductase subunit 3 (subunit A)